MKQSKTIIVIVAIAVALVALAIGLGIREIRSRRAGVVHQASTELEGERTERRLLPGGGEQGGFRNLSDEERAKIREERQKMVERMQNMSEEEKEAFRAKIRERFDVSRQGEGTRYGTLSPEERAKMREEWEKMRERWMDMSEQERREFMAKMRGKFSARRPVVEVNEVNDVK